MADDLEPPRGDDVQPPVRPPAPPPFLGRFAWLYGILAGLALYGLGFAVSLFAINGSGDIGTVFFFWLVSTVGIILATLVAGGVMAGFPRTRAFGAGLLISAAVNILVGGGACVALLANAGG